MVSRILGVLHVNFVWPIHARLAGDGGEDHAGLWLRTRADANGFSCSILLAGIWVVSKGRREVLVSRWYQRSSGHRCLDGIEGRRNTAVYVVSKVVGEYWCLGGIKGPRETLVSGWYRGRRETLVSGGCRRKNAVCVVSNRREILEKHQVLSVWYPRVVERRRVSDSISLAQVIRAFFATSEPSWL